MRDRNKNKVRVRYQFVEKWDIIIREALDRSMSKWQLARRNKAVIANEKPYSPEGNLVHQSLQQLKARLLDKGVSVTVESHDPKFRDAAASDTIIARAIADSSELQASLLKMFDDAGAHAFACLEVGHPLDIWSNDITRRFWQENNARLNDLEDEYVEIRLEDLIAMGYSAEEADQLTPEQQQQLAIRNGGERPKPVFNPAFGYPWVQLIDPRLILLPQGATEPREYDYIARLRFVTGAELKLVQSFKPRRQTGNAVMYESLFRETEKSPDIQLLNQGDYYLIVELWLIRERDDPMMSNYYMSWILGEPTEVIRACPNPWEGITPFTFFRLNPIRPLDTKTTFVDDLLPFAQLYADSIDLIRQEIKWGRSFKWAASETAFKDQAEAKKALDPNYSGLVKSRDPKSITRIMETSVSSGNLQASMFIKSLVQAHIKQTPMEEGIAVKSITAEQTRALLDAVGMNVMMTVQELRRVVSTVMMKMLHLAALYGMGVDSSDRQIHSTDFRFSEGSGDLVTSRIFKVTIKDALDEGGNAELISYSQFLRVLWQDGTGALRQQFDDRELARELLRRSGLPDTLLREATPAGAQMAQGGTGEEQLPPEALANLIAQGGAVMPGMLPSQGVQGAQGQHPERMIGDRGSSMSNAMSGMGRIGSGVGES